MAERFNITYRHGYYHVSIPNYKGGEVVDAASFDAVESTVDLLEKNAGIQAKLLADTARQRDDLVKALTDLCDEIASEEQHGDGADDSGCQTCRAHKRARKLLAAAVGGSRE